ncbi:TonB-dependent receptor [Aegicerativicinus sediminis]|uniref:TonB-dependent receptor n=1 Tax=Aegicerativicinus sediminis TaxID=2893202 RepID=UPI001E3F8692|nr:TonB-dependent receptor [Aegicerativicinus sediminis]
MIKKLTQFVFITAVFLITSVALGQSTLSGTIMDADMNAPLPGANIIEKGTSNGTTSDFDGNFTLTTTATSGQIVISYVGYTSVTLNFNGDTNFGSITITPGNALDEVVVTGVGVIDLARERETPVAVSTIRASEIQNKVGNMEFPEIMNTTPSVYATKDGGGYGDSRINVRGFDQRNLAIVINGQPVNDMENGWVYWSNWAGLSDIASGIQIQRGLGASKLAVPSVGGTITVVTKTTEKSQGGFGAFTAGNDGYLKKVVGYNTGTNEKGWASSVLLGHWNGDGYVDGTKGEGYTYLFSLGYKPSETHAFNFTFTGAGQWHHQRSTWLSIRDHFNFGGDDFRKFNADWGYKNGEEYSIRRNFYNKPIGTLNWDWNINDKLSLSSSFYGSWGRGGGTGARGNNFRNSDIDLFPFNRDFTDHVAGGNGMASRNDDYSIDFDNVMAVNRATTNPYTGPNSNYEGLLIGSNGFREDEVNRAILIRRASMNSHNWYGAISNLKYESGFWTLGGGIDLRTYTGYHYRVLNDLMGLDGYYSTGNRNLVNGVILTETTAASPFKDTGIAGDKIDYYNLGKVNWFGFNGIVEYNNEETLSAVLQAGLSNQTYQRIDYFDQPNNVESDKESITGGYVKGGANYNINDYHNVFFNIGVISKQPIFDAVFPNFANIVNEDLVNEKIFSFELGYGFRGSNLSANLNLYSTSWKDRFISRGIDLGGGVDGTANFQGVKQLHQGIELDLNYRPLSNLRIDGMLSIGNWRYTDDVEASVFDDNQSLIGTSTLYLKDVKVGDAAQFTSNLGVDWEIFERFRVNANWRHAANLYADFNPDDSIFLDEDNPGAIELPSYSLFDAGVGYGFDLWGDTTLYLRANINNVFDTEYIAESNSNIHTTSSSQTYKGIDETNYVWFGFGRTWNISARFNF